MTDDLKSKAERAAYAYMERFRQFKQNDHLHPWVAARIGYAEGMLAHAKEAEALVSKLESCLERIGQMEGYCVAIEDAEAAIARYRGGANGK